MSCKETTVGALIWCPFPSLPAARICSNTLLDEGLVVCANLIPVVESHYVWRGERGNSAEVGALFKTTTSLLEAAIARLAVLHPYDCPAILGWPCSTAAPQTLAWLGGLRP